MFLGKLPKVFPLILKISMNHHAAWKKNYIVYNRSLELQSKLKQN